MILTYAKPLQDLNALWDRVQRGEIDKLAMCGKTNRSV